MLNVLGYADFADRVDTEFVMQLSDSAQVRLVLTECVGVPDRFSLTFKAGYGAPQQQGLYQLSAAGFGPEVVFLVPVALRSHDSDFPLEYQAIFNSIPVPGGST